MSAVTSQRRAPERPFVTNFWSVEVANQDGESFSSICHVSPGQSRELFEVLVSLLQFQVTPDSVHECVRRWAPTRRPTEPQLFVEPSTMLSSREAERIVPVPTAFDIAASSNCTKVLRLPSPLTFKMLSEPKFWLGLPFLR